MPLNTTRHRRAASLLLVAALATCAGCAEMGPMDSNEGLLEDGPSIVSVDGKADGIALAAYAPLPASAALDMQLEVLFAPDDPVQTLEVTLIDQVIAARALDSEPYPEGENPFRIRYAVYNLRNEGIIARLIDAERAGVDVQILIDAQQLDPAKDYNTADEVLVDAGFELIADHRALTDSQRATADLIGIKRSGLMHLKTRIFETPGAAVLLTGSLNPGDNAMLNEETLHLVRDRRIVDKYVAAYEHVLRGEGMTNSWDAAQAVNVLFTPAATGPRAGARVLDWLAEEDEQILLMVFSLRDVSASDHGDSLVDILTAKAAAGVPVYVITDRKQSDGVDAEGNHLYANDRTEDRLRAGGVHVFEAMNYASPFNAMHHKVAVLGRTRVRVITDAANWTAAGLGSARSVARNVESQLFIDTALLADPRIGHRYVAQWLRVLERYAGQSAGDGEPTFEEVRDSLLSREDWPTWETVFSVAQASTAWGEHVWIRGSLDALGVWGEGHEGVPLFTSDASYPTWESGHIALPVGATFGYKAVAGFAAETVRWEGGDDHHGFVIPAVFDDTAALRISSSWQ